MSVSGPLTRVNEATIERYVKIALEGGRRIAAELGYAPSAGALEHVQGDAAGA
jgi:hypothetical protein